MECSFVVAWTVQGPCIDCPELNDQLAPKTPGIPTYGIPTTTVGIPVNTHEIPTYGIPTINFSRYITLALSLSGCVIIFSRLLPILDNTDYIPTPIANSTTLNVNDDDLKTTFLHNLLSDANRFILSSDDPILPTVQDLSDPEETTGSSIILSSYSTADGDVASNVATTATCTLTTKAGLTDIATGKQYTPPCKGQLTNLGSTVTKEAPHSHPPSLKTLCVKHLLSNIRTDNNTETVANVVRGVILDAPNQAHKVVFINGTFKVSPKRFKQIWTVRGYLGNTCVPLMYFLLNDKSGS